MAQTMAQEAMATCRANGYKVTVLVVDALHHMADVGAVLRNTLRFVAPGAWFVAVEPQSANPVIQALRWARGRVDRSYSHEQHFFAPGELEELLRCHNLSEIEAVCEGYFSTPFAQVVLPVQGVAAPLAGAAVRLDELLAGRSEPAGGPHADS